ncbi:MAG: glycosyltransferase [Methylophaga sp.]|uniref:glycosyltransferase n=1 Tax=Methylophaga sp. TaxID=2024840 RepID=UPI000C0E35CA|nr:glycosyltransferase [Methylophaga sp.]MBL1457687.1 glycosyltransferase [Methylophaga sp.]
MNVNKPKLSVIMPVYNGARYLKEAIESVLNQSFRDFEFIILDDGSNDNSLQIIKSYAGIDSRIRYFTRENRGIVDTLNECLDLAQAELIARMDADDICLSDRFMVQVEYLNTNSDVVLVGSVVIIIDEDGDEIAPMGKFFDNDTLHQAFLRDGGQHIYHPSVIYRRALVKQVGAYNKAYPNIEDLELFMKLFNVGKLENLSTPLLKYREHLEKIGHTKRIQQQQQVADLLSKARTNTRTNFKQLTSTKSSKVQSLTQKYQTWAWWALKAGNKKSARKYLRKSFISAPFSLHNVKLMMCVLRGY